MHRIKDEEVGEVRIIPIAGGQKAEMYYTGCKRTYILKNNEVRIDWACSGDGGGAFSDDLTLQPGRVHVNNGFFRETDPWQNIPPAVYREVHDAMARAFKEFAEQSHHKQQDHKKIASVATQLDKLRDEITLDWDNGIDSQEQTRIIKLARAVAKTR